MKYWQRGSTLVGQIGLTTCLLLLCSLIYLWMQYHQQLLRARLEQMQCLKQKSDGIEKVVKKINLLNRSIAAIQVMSTITPAMAKSITSIQTLQNIIWYQFIIAAHTYKHCPLFLKKYSRAELPYKTQHMKLMRNAAGMAQPQLSLQLSLPLRLFGNFSEWWIQNTLQLHGQINNQFSSKIVWSML